MAKKKGRRQYGTGSIYQRHSAAAGCPPLEDGPPHPRTGKPTKVRPPHVCKGRWEATFEGGWSASGGRRRPIVTGPTEAVVKNKLKRMQAEAAKVGPESVQGRAVTVKSWSEEWLTIRVRKVRPKTYDTDEGAIRWALPVIGTRKLSALTPADIRKVVAAMRTGTKGQQGLKQASIARYHRALLKMLKDAVAEGHHVPAAVFTATPGGEGPNDRDAVSRDDAIRMLSKASEGPDGGTRWLVSFCQALRQAEALGLTWEAIDFERDLIIVNWQLQSLPYVDLKNKSLGFRIPDGYAARRLVGAFHLVTPKSNKGTRIVPMVPVVREALLLWKEVSPPNPYGLVWARTGTKDGKRDGWPIDKADDTSAWHQLQAAVGVAHPSGRPYVGHEMRHTMATMLMEAGVDPAVIIAIMGHSNIVTSRGYMHVRTEQAKQALEQVAMKLHELPSSGDAQG